MRTKCKTDESLSHSFTDRKKNSIKNITHSLNCVFIILLFTAALHSLSALRSVYRLDEMTTRKHCLRIDTIPSPDEYVAVVRTRINHFK